MSAMELVEAIIKGAIIVAAVALEGLCSLAQTLPDFDFLRHVFQGAFDLVTHCFSRRREE